MLLFIIMVSWMLSMIFMFLTHPLSLGFILLMQTIIISIISGILNYDYWFSYILFLVMIGGMLVLFIYMTSIASNEKFSFSKQAAILAMLFSMMMFMFLFMDNFFYMTDMFSYNLMNQTNETYLSMSKYMSLPNILILFMIILYLLATLIAIVKITGSNWGPLRQS